MSVSVGYYVYSDIFILISSCYIKSIIIGMIPA